MAKKVLLHEWHAHNGELTEFSGFLMPVRYSKIVTEHLAVRNAAGLFDVSHMGRVAVEGEDALRFLDVLVPRDLERVMDGKCAYTFLLNHQATFMDDLVLLRENESSWKVVWNAGNRKKNWQWVNNLRNIIKEHKTDFNVTLRDLSDESVMFALQGPLSEEILKESLNLSDTDIPPKPWSFTKLQLKGLTTYISRTGYTGEDGFEISIYGLTTTNIDQVQEIWESILETGASRGLLPCGLGARDTLRLEAGYCLYGNDIDETITPVEADLSFPPFVHVDKPRYFIGKERLKELLEDSSEISTKRVGILSLKRGPKPEPGMKLHNEEGNEVGHVTSGSLSPLLNKNIGMAYVLKTRAQEGTILWYEKRGKRYQVMVKSFPFYDPEKYGSRRKKNNG